MTQFEVVSFVERHPDAPALVPAGRGISRAALILHAKILRSA